MPQSSVEECWDPTGMLKKILYLPARSLLALKLQRRQGATFGN